MKGLGWTGQEVNSKDAGFFAAKCIPLPYPSPTEKANAPGKPPQSHGVSRPYPHLQNVWSGKEAMALQESTALSATESILYYTDRVFVL